MMSPQPLIEPTSRLGPGNYRSLARKSGLTPQHISRVLRGLKGTSLAVAARIADAAEVTLDQLYGFIVRSPRVLDRPARRRPTLRIVNRKVRVKR